MELHPLAELIPPMTEAEYADLKEKIAANGQREPITLHEGRILDGRHRYRICEELGITPLTREFDGDDPVAYVIDLNLSRRHLTNGQRAMAAQGLLGYEKEQAKQRQQRGGVEKVPQNSGEPRHRREAVAQAGKKFGVSGDSVERARAIAAQRPDLAEKVKSGELTLNAAVEEHRGYSTNTGKPKTKMHGVRKAAHARKVVESVVARSNNTTLVLSQIDLDAVTEATNEREAREWAQQLRTARTALSSLIKALEKA